jgi:predicted DNA-binding protein (MmcQ/YjbR family)
MDFDLIQSYCLSMPDAVEDTPFGPNVLVFKVNTKMFALMSFTGDQLHLNLKNTPEKNIELREEYEYIIPGYHMNKKHWNTLVIHSYIDTKLIQQLISESYRAVIGKKK